MRRGLGTELGGDTGVCIGRAEMLQGIVSLEDRRVDRIRPLTRVRWVALLARALHRIRASRRIQHAAEVVGEGRCVLVGVMLLLLG